MACRSMWGVGVKLILAIVTGAGEQLGETQWGERPQRSEAKTKGEADWRFSSRMLV